MRANRRPILLPGWLALLLFGSAPLAAPLPAAALPAALPAFTFSAGSLEYADRRFEDARLSLDAAGVFRFSFERMQGAGAEFLGQGLVVEGALEEFVREEQDLTVRATLRSSGLAGRLLVRRGAGELRLELATTDQPVTALGDFPGLPEAVGWCSRGRFDAGLEILQADGHPPAIAFRFGATDLSFDSPDGRYAGEALQLAARGSLHPADEPAVELEGGIAEGELLLGDFYRNFADAGLNFAGGGRWTASGAELTRIRVDDGGALTLEAGARLRSVAGESQWSLEVSSLELVFPAAYRRYLEPLAAAWTLDGLELTGAVSWSGEWAAGALASGDLEISDLSVVDVRRQRFAVTGLSARLRPGDHAFDSRLNWQGLLVGRVNLGAGSALLDSEPGAIALLEPLHLEVLGGGLDLKALKIALPGGRADGTDEPDISLRASIADLDMALLTAALDWPAFGGRISGEIPGVSLDDGVLAVDGEIRFEVFDGLISFGNLGIERPFGVLPSLAADVEISNIDLEQLTSTFSFGQIVGRLDGYVRDLRMLDWKPVAFDAWLGTPERQSGANDISRKAVNRLTTIGGGSATTALTGPLMRMFSNFSYRRLGLGCSLQNYVCHLQGLTDEGDGVLILEGAGVPKITIRAFNREIDWPQMVSNLLAISEGESIRIGEKPDS
jgi:hypothetical protein